MPDFITINLSNYYNEVETYFFNVETKTTEEEYKQYDEILEKYGERTVLDFAINGYKWDYNKIGVLIIIAEE